MKGWETYKKQYNQCSQCWENCNSLQKRVVIQLSCKNHERSNFIRRSSKRLLLGIFLPLCERNWWAIGAENDDNRYFSMKIVLFFFALCPGNLGKCLRLMRFVEDLNRKSLKIMRDQGSSLKTRWHGTFLLIDSFRFWVANFFRFHFTVLCNIRHVFFNVRACSFVTIKLRIISCCNIRIDRCVIRW